MEKIVEIQSGSLTFTVNHQLSSKQYTLFDLLTFGSRQNPKRGFLFISKVLGKHIPCQPSVMSCVYAALAEQIQLEAGPCVLVGLAETATGLGAGVAETLFQLGHDVLYTHTTRYHLANTPIIFSIDESHSHAPVHIIYQPTNPFQLKQAQTAILVDDEITTGNTLLQLAEHLIDYTEGLKKIVWVSLVSWLSEQRKSEIQQQLPGVKVEFVCLVAGHFQFTPRSMHSSQLPAKTQLSISSQAVLADIRTGIDFNHSNNHFYTITGERFTIESLAKTDQYTVLGYGEFLYQPYKLAEEMEKAGFDVLFQSTTRSPILEGDGILHKEVFSIENNYENYIYNRPKERITIIAYETYAQYQHCGLAQKINCIPIIKDATEVR
ncbi:phosphoribosyltransferase domain-containing protein [Zooshikella sp. RANM57]|uniref:phosphoribosyltransferase domain-containing protein n=1 Tax=Zooshikella sp. RANM57 TaxID=3425863 RepID=UPI003D6E7103